ncbi:MAG: hypothetical protein U0694_01045 [Anaerolineae bacterium]
MLFIAGTYIVVATVNSAIKTFVLPRSANVWLTRQIFRVIGSLFRFRALKASSYEDRDRLMAMYAPTTLIAMPVVWMICVWLGYGLIYAALNITPFIDALRLSGSSLLTLGIVVPPTLLTTLLAFSEAVLGLILIALLIGYLPTMYATFSRRELAVNLLEVRAGSPPSAIELIKRAHRIRGLDSLGDLWTQWEAWFAELEETHTSLGALVFFRSPTPTHSWVTASGAVLDAAALVTSTVDVPRDPRRELCIRAGYLALRSISDFFRITYNHDPKPSDPISITREEFDAAYDELHEAGVPLKADRDQCWHDFAGWRVNYDRVLLALAMLTIAPYAPWSSDRGMPDMRPGSIPEPQKRAKKLRK